MKKLLTALLKRLAKKTLKAYKPKVVAITGSVGKTSTRRAIEVALGGSRKVRGSAGNYNNELGLPLAILNEEAKGKSLFGWIGVAWRGWKLSWGSKEYPEILVLEYGSDKPGDILYLTQIARPYISVVTAVGVAHAEALGTIEDIKEEKGTLVRALADDGIAILNGDDARVADMQHIAKGAVVTFGIGTADVHAENVSLETRHDGDIAIGEVVARLGFDLVAGQNRAKVTVDNIVGDAHMRAMLAGAAVALQLGYELPQIALNLSNYQPVPGRMSLLTGIKRSLLIDDTYNASPDAVHVGLDVLSSIPLTGEAKRVVALGDMLELGRYAETAHVDVGKHVASMPIDLLVCVGEHSRDIARGALSAGMEQEKVFTYASSTDAGRFIQDRMVKGDVVLIKGSQGARMEKIVKEIMAEPLRAKELLVRQSNYWLSR